MRKNNIVNVRLSDEDLQFCNTMAKDVGWTVSGYIRYLIETEKSLIDFEKEFNNADV